MKSDSFFQRKNDILSKKDKSFKGNWDNKIIDLCDKINSKKNYYTTSSCSGRIVLIYDEEKKQNNLFIQIWHDLLNFKELKQSLKKINSKKSIKFKQEPCIIHIACRDLEKAIDFLNKARKIGFKRGGVISISKQKIILELQSTERLEFLIKNKGEILVNDNFLKEIIKKANFNLKKNWNKIDKLRKVI